jgi:RHS repeat-associated protein
MIGLLRRKTTSTSSDYYVPTSTTFSNGKKTTAEYLFNNNLQEAKDYPTRVVDIGGNDRKYTYDSFGRMKTSTDLGDGVYGYSYTDKGLSQITSPTGETLKYEYDSLGNLKKTINGDGSAVTNSYNASDNRLAKTTLASGDEITFQYDSAGKVISQSATKGGTTGYTYNADGAITTLTDASGDITYSYNSKGQVIKVLNPNGSSIAYEYDLLGRVTKETSKATLTAAGLATQYGYDQLGNLKTVTDPTGGITTMNYDIVNRLIERILPNGITSTYSYNEDDQVISLVHKDSSGTVLASVSYERKGTGEPSKITREDGSYVSLEYDSALRLTKESYFTSANLLEQRIDYSYDASGKRTAVVDSAGTHGYTYNNAYQLQSVTNGTGTDTYSYDADGRLDGFSRDGSTVDLDRDSYDRLTKVNDGSGTVTSYLYDAQGNRIGENQGTTQRRYLVGSEGGLSATKLIADGSGNLVSSYVYSGGYTPFLRLDADGNAVYYLTDVMGSVIGLANQAGQKSASFAYDAFGNLRSSSGADSAAVTGGDFRFQGQWLESESGLYYFRARDYDSKTGLFLSRDAVPPTEQQPESMNPYQFAYQNPLVYSDPSGMFTILELNSSQSIQKILDASQQALYNQLRQDLINKVKAIPGQFLQNLIQKLNPLSYFDSIFEKVPILSGNKLENALTLNICGLIGGSYAQYLDALHFQVPVSRDGEPFGNGFGCSVSLIPPPKVRSKDLKGFSIKRPDFIIKQGLPKDTDMKPKAYLIGDVTRSLDGVYSKVTGSQGEAILNYAKFSNNHQYTPVALFVTLFGGSQQTYEKTVKYGIERYGVVVLGAPLLASAKNGSPL